jgi:hypothetical protein
MATATAPSRMERGLGVHRVSIVTADGCFETLADAPGSANPSLERLIRQGLGAVSMLPKLLVAGSNPVARSKLSAISGSRDVPNIRRIIGAS